MNPFVQFVVGIGAGLIGSAIFVPIFLGLFKVLGVFATIPEGTSKVYTLFGKVVGVVDEPGLNFLVAKLGLGAFLVPYFGKAYTVDTRVDQTYLRSQPVNSEEGTPMGIGVWYEMQVTRPVDFLFKNSDPIGSLRANVTNATVRCLSNMPLADLLENRHGMSRVVRKEVSPKSEEWGYRLGSVYIRKVHFRDATMISQIQQKVANRLLQVTSAIRQAGANQVDVIKSTADKEAAAEFARAAAMRPYVVGNALNEVAEDPEVLETLMEVLRLDRIRKSDAELTLLPASGGELLASLLAAEGTMPGIPSQKKKRGGDAVPPPLHVSGPPAMPGT